MHRGRATGGASHLRSHTLAPTGFTSSRTAAQGWAFPSHVPPVFHMKQCPPADRGTYASAWTHILNLDVISACYGNISDFASEMLIAW